MTERNITKSDCKYYRESDGNCLNFTYVGEYDPCTDGDLEHCYEKFPHFFNKVERMIAKRFIPIFDGTDKRVVGAKDNGKIISFMDMFDLLNDLSDENEQLKQQIGNLEHTRDFCAECCERLEKENEELKFEIRKVQRAYEQLWEHTYK